MDVKLLPPLINLDNYLHIGLTYDKFYEILKLVFQVILQNTLRFAYKTPYKINVNKKNHFS